MVLSKYKLFLHSGWFPKEEREAIFAVSHGFPSSKDFMLVTYLKADNIGCNVQAQKEKKRGGRGRNKEENTCLLFKLTMVREGLQPRATPL